MATSPWIDDEPDVGVGEEFPELIGEARRLLPGLTPEQYLLVASLVVDTCRGCYAAGAARCTCVRED